MLKMLINYGKKTRFMRKDTTFNKNLKTQKITCVDENA